VTQHLWQEHTATRVERRSAMDPYPALSRSRAGVQAGSAAAASMQPKKAPASRSCIVARSGCPVRSHARQTLFTSSSQPRSASSRTNGGWGCARARRDKPTAWSSTRRAMSASSGSVARPARQQRVRGPRRPTSPPCRSRLTSTTSTAACCRVPPTGSGTASVAGWSDPGHSSAVPAFPLLNTDQVLTVQHTGPRHRCGPAREAPSRTAHPSEISKLVGYATSSDPELGRSLHPRDHRR
jgi:hypothetical protein